MISEPVRATSCSCPPSIRMENPRATAAAPVRCTESISLAPSRCTTTPENEHTSRHDDAFQPARLERAVLQGVGNVYPVCVQHTGRVQGSGASPVFSEV